MLMSVVLSPPRSSVHSGAGRSSGQAAWHWGRIGILRSWDILGYDRAQNEDCDPAKLTSNPVKSAHWERTVKENLYSGLLCSFNTPRCWENRICFNLIWTSFVLLFPVTTVTLLNVFFKFNFEVASNFTLSIRYSCCCWLHQFTASLQKSPSWQTCSMQRLHKTSPGASAVPLAVAPPQGRAHISHRPAEAAHISGGRSAFSLQHPGALMLGWDCSIPWATCRWAPCKAAEEDSYIKAI